MAPGGARSASPDRTSPSPSTSYNKFVSSKPSTPSNRGGSHATARSPSHASNNSPTGGTLLYSGATRSSAPGVMHGNNPYTSTAPASPGMRPRFSGTRPASALPVQRQPHHYQPVVCEYNRPMSALLPSTRPTSAMSEAGGGPQGGVLKSICRHVHAESMTLNRDQESLAEEWHQLMVAVDASHPEYVATPIARDVDSYTLAYAILLLREGILDPSQASADCYACNLSRSINHDVLNALLDRAVKCMRKAGRMRPMSATPDFVNMTDGDRIALLKRIYGGNVKPSQNRKPRLRLYNLPDLPDDDEEPPAPVKANKSPPKRAPPKRPATSPAPAPVATRMPVVANQKPASGRSTIAPAQTEYIDDIPNDDGGVSEPETPTAAPAEQLPSCQKSTQTDPWYGVTTAGTGTDEGLQADGEGMQAEGVQTDATEGMQDEGLQADTSAEADSRSTGGMQDACVQTEELGGETAPSMADATQWDAADFMSAESEAEMLARLGYPAVGAEAVATFADQAAKALEAMMELAEGMKKEAADATRDGGVRAGEMAEAAEGMDPGARLEPKAGGEEGEGEGEQGDGGDGEGKEEGKDGVQGQEEGGGEGPEGAENEVAEGKEAQAGGAQAHGEEGVEAEAGDAKGIAGAAAAGGADADAQSAATAATANGLAGVYKRLDRLTKDALLLGADVPQELRSAAGMPAGAGGTGVGATPQFVTALLPAQADAGAAPAAASPSTSCGADSPFAGFVLAPYEAPASAAPKAERSSRGKRDVDDMEERPSVEPFRVEGEVSFVPGVADDSEPPEGSSDAVKLEHRQRREAAKRHKQQLQQQQQEKAALQSQGSWVEAVPMYAFTPGGADAAAGAAAAAGPPPPPELAGALQALREAQARLGGLGAATCEQVLHAMLRSGGVLFYSPEEDPLAASGLPSLVPLLQQLQDAGTGLVRGFAAAAAACLGVAAAADVQADGDAVNAARMHAFTAALADAADAAAATTRLLRVLADKAAMARRILATRPRPSAESPALELAVDLAAIAEARYAAMLAYASPALVAMQQLSEVWAPRGNDPAACEAGMVLVRQLFTQLRDFSLEVAKGVGDAYEVQQRGAKPLGLPEGTLGASPVEAAAAMVANLGALVGAVEALYGVDHVKEEAEEERVRQEEEQRWRQEEERATQEAEEKRLREQAENGQGMEGEGQQEEGGVEGEEGEGQQAEGGEEQQAEGEGQPADAEGEEEPAAGEERFAEGEEQQAEGAGEQADGEDMQAEGQGRQAEGAGEQGEQATGEEQQADGEAQQANGDEDQEAQEQPTAGEGQQTEAGAEEQLPAGGQHRAADGQQVAGQQDTEQSDAMFSAAAAHTGEADGPEAVMSAGPRPIAEGVEDEGEAEQVEQAAGSEHSLAGGVGRAEGAELAGGEDSTAAQLAQLPAAPQTERTSPPRPSALAQSSTRRQRERRASNLPLTEAEVKEETEAVVADVMESVAENLTETIAQAVARAMASAVDYDVVPLEVVRRERSRATVAAPPGGGEGGTGQSGGFGSRAASAAAAEVSGFASADEGEEGREEGGQDGEGEQEEEGQEAQGGQEGQAEGQADGEEAQQQGAGEADSGDDADADAEAASREEEAEAPMVEGTAADGPMAQDAMEPFSAEEQDVEATGAGRAAAQAAEGPPTPPQRQEPAVKLRHASALLPVLQGCTLHAGALLDAFFLTYHRAWDVMRAHALHEGRQAADMPSYLDLLQQLADAKKQLEGAKVELARTKQQLADSETAHEATKAELEDVRRQLEAALARIAELEALMKELQEELEKAKEELEKAKQELLAAKAALLAAEAAAKQAQEDAAAGIEAAKGVAKLQDEIKAKDKRIQELEDRLKEAEKEIEALKKKVEELEKALADERNKPAEPEVVDEKKCCGCF